MVETREAFLHRAAATEGDCLIWPYAVRASSGYGAHSRPRPEGHANIDAHVRVCELAHGPRPTPEHQAAHSCGNRLCCTGDHLRWATPVENMADAKAHRTLKGGGRYRQRLFAQHVEAICKSPLSLVALGRELNMEPAYLGHVRRRGRLAQAA